MIKKKENVALIMKMGSLKKKRLYTKGKLEGEYFYYYSSGKLWIKNNYKNGLLHGERKVFLKMENLKKKSNLKMDLTYQALTIKIIITKRVKK